MRHAPPARFYPGLFALLWGCLVAAPALWADGKGLPGEKNLPAGAFDRSRMIVRLSPPSVRAAAPVSALGLAARLINNSSAAAAVKSVAPLFQAAPVPAGAAAYQSHGLELFAVVTLADLTAAAKLRADLAARPEVEQVYFAFRPRRPPVKRHDIPPRTPLFADRQEYTRPAPRGMDIAFARTQAGGDGAGVTIADSEFGWEFRHEDLPLNARSFFWRSPRQWYLKHGTAVAGILVGIDNAYGVRGIADAAQLRLAPAMDQGGDYNPALAIQQAAARLSPGDILLLEQQLDGPGTAVCRCGSECQYLVPVEYDPAVFAAIRYASDLGLIVVEAAGNGGVDLDSPVFEGAFNPDTHDSGAVMVAAMIPQTGQGACFSDSGRRIDVNSWGGSVVTTGYGDLFPPKKSLPARLRRHQTYTTMFGGTSSASALTAGAAAALQGFAKAHGGALAPAALRSFLTYTGTPASEPGFGSMPDLRAAITAVKAGRGL